METARGKLPPPPRLVNALGRGFDVTASHIWIILLPVILDLFLWLGPRLSLAKVFESFGALSAGLQAPNMPDPADVQALWSSLAERFNLFALLRTFPVGVTSLMTGHLPVETPFGQPPVIQADSFLPLLGWCLLVLGLGWLLGGLFFHWVARVSVQSEQPPRLLGAIGQVMILSLFWLVLAGVASLPLLLVFGLISLVSPFLSQVVLFLASLAALWLLLPVFFSPHGIYLYRQNALAAIMHSLRMTRFTVPTTGLFVVLAALISMGLDYLWRIPSEASWLTLVGIGGHAFISTGLLAASFIYYRDINTWLQLVFDQLKTQADSVHA